MGHVWIYVVSASSDPDNLKNLLNNPIFAPPDGY
jgi:hypothetical protein